MAPLTASEIDLIKTTTAHLESLQRLSTPWTDEHKLRVATASLRLLLVDDLLLRAWKASKIGGPIVIRAWCFKKNASPNAIGFCGGADILPGIPVSATEVEIESKLLDLTSFLRMACVQAKGAQISRRELIQYLANTRGGSHYDEFSKKKAFGILHQLEETNCFETGVGLLLNSRNLIHHEAASILQALLSSIQVEQLMSFGAKL